MKKVAKETLKAIKKIGYDFGVNLQVNRINSIQKRLRTGLNLNIGAADYVIEGFKSLDYYSEHYYKSRKEFDKARIHYDIRSMAIPSSSDSVDNIYCSHVIEHIEEDFVKKFIDDSFRVLKREGVLRIACPDVEFMYKMAGFRNDYFAWHPLFNPDNQIAAFIDECATDNEVAKANFMQKSHDTFNGFLTSFDPLPFDPANIHRHISQWTFEKLKNIGENCGFSRVVLSKPGASVSGAMQGPDMDLPHREMSLYVDFVK